MNSIDVEDLVRNREIHQARALALAMKLGRERLTNNHAAFSEATMVDERGVPIKLAPIHRVWDAHFEACREARMFCGLVAPFGHGKSVRNVVGRAAFELGRDPNLRLKVVCAGDDNAKNRVMSISSLMRQRSYRRIFPSIREVSAKRARERGAKREWTKHSIFLDRTGSSIDPSLQAFGVLASGTGTRADGILFDDVVDHRNAIDSPALREKVISNIENVWLSRLEPWGWVQYVGTPWHEADATHWILKQRGWCVLWQWISDDLTRIEQQVFNPPPNYPIPAYSRLVEDEVQSERWV